MTSTARESIKIKRLQVFRLFLAPTVLLLAFLAACVQRADIPRPIDSAAVTATPAPPLPGETGRLELAGALGHGPIRAFAVQEDWAYVGLGRMLEVLRFTDLAQPQRTGYVVLPQEVLDVAVARAPFTGGARSLRAVQACAYVALGQGGLGVIDVSDPARPVVVGTHYASSYVSAVVVRGATLYVSASGELGVMRIDDPAAPAEVGRYRPADPPGSVDKVIAVSGGIAYLIYHGGSGQAGGLRVVDVSEPAAPFEVGAYRAGVPVRDATMAGDRAHLLVGEGVPYLVIVDLSDPSHPVPVGPAGTGAWSGQSLDVAGEILYLAARDAADDTGHLSILHVADPAHPAALGRIEDLPLPITEIVAGDKRAFLAAGDRLLAIDVSDPERPHFAGNYSLDVLPSVGKGIAVEGEHAFIAAGRDGLWVVDISDPTHPRVAGRLDTAGHAWSVALWAGHAYVADEQGGLRAIDVRDPAHPLEAGHYDVPGASVFFCDVAIHTARSTDRPYAYIADALPGETSLRVVDLSDPAAPLPVGHLPLGAGLEGDVRAYGVAVADDTAYVALGAGGLRVIDVSDPSNPVEVGAYDVPGRADNLVVAGDRVYLVDGDLRIVDVSDPVSPREVGFYDVPGLSPWPHVAVDGRYAYLAAGGTSVLDVSDPGVPVEVATYPLAQGDVAVANGMVYVIGDGLTILRPRPPVEASPAPTVTLKAACETPSAAISLRAADPRPYVGEVLTVTATLVNQGCGMLGMPRTSLHVETEGQEPVFVATPEAVVHYVGLASGQSDTVEYTLRADKPGRAALTVAASFEFHDGHPGSAYWSSAAGGPLKITVRSPEPKPVPEDGLVCFVPAEAPAKVCLPPGTSIISYTTTPDGVLWYALDKFDDIGGSPPSSQHYGLYRSQDGQVSHLNIPCTIRVLAVAPDGSLYIGAGRGVLRYAGGRLETLADVEHGPETNLRGFFPFGIAFTPEGDVWVGGVHSLARYDGSTWTQYDVPVRRLFVAPDGSLWGEGWDGVVGSGCCYVHVTGDRWVTYTHSAALPVSRELLSDIHRLRD